MFWAKKRTKIGYWNVLSKTVQYNFTSLTADTYIYIYIDPTYIVLFVTGQAGLGVSQSKLVLSGPWHESGPI